MKAIKQFIGGLLFCVVEILVGILLLIDPIGLTSGIIVTCGSILIAVGIFTVIRYFRLEPEAASHTKLLTMAMLMILSGGFCVLKTGWLITVLPMMTIVYGLIILVSGLGKAQWAVDMLRTKKGKWPLAAISAVISVACGAVILCNPFTTTAFLWTFTGISLIFEALMDVVTFIFSGFRKEESSAPEETSPTPEAEATEN